MTTSDGRTLALCEVGDPDGRPALYLHGTGSSRLEAALYHEAFAAEGVRLVAWDRPGSGGSTPRLGRRLVDVVDDVRRLCAALELSERPVAVGLSGGGSHAIALACRAADAVGAAVAVNPGGPAEDWLLRGVPRSVAFTMRCARDNPARWDRLGRLAEKQDRGPVGTWLAHRLLDRKDREVLASPHVAEAFARATAEGARQPRAYTQEARMLWAQPWDVDLDQIRIPLHVFSGTRDPFRRYAEHLGSHAGAALHWFDGGHVSHLRPDVLRRLAMTTAAARALS